ncbi:MAG: hypothetical protein E6Q97_24085 [Desulfurellales bacterium]|nr:MAG: hypothetical protein E6Q97_24085 [Desulfurellales bacterium]
MIATVNLPGSSHFNYFRGTKTECEQWLADMESEYQEQFGGTWWNAYAPARITNEKTARTWKYRDGSRVIRELK